MGLLLLVCACATACAGTGLFQSEQRTLVRLYDADTGVRLELANETHPEYRGIYSHPRAEASLKLAPDGAMDQLLDRLDDLKFDKLSTPGGPPQGATTLGWITVTDDDESRTFVVPEKGATREQLASFAQMQFAVNDVYNHVSGLQFIDNPQGADLFRKQRAAGTQP